MFVAVCAFLSQKVLFASFYLVSSQLERTVNVNGVE